MDVVRADTKNWSVIAAKLRNDQRLWRIRRNGLVDSVTNAPKTPMTIVISFSNKPTGTKRLAGVRNGN
jgi:hypothetical protein